MSQRFNCSFFRIRNVTNINKLTQRVGNMKFRRTRTTIAPILPAPRTEVFNSGAISNLFRCHYQSKLLGNVFTPDQIEDVPINLFPLAQHCCIWSSLKWRIVLFFTLRPVRMKLYVQKFIAVVEQCLRSQKAVLMR